MPGINLTRDEAAERARLLHVATYDITLDLTTSDTTFGSTTVIRFSCREPGAATFADLVGAQVHEITLNGRMIDPAAYVDSRIPLDDLQADNELRVVADCRYSHTGEGLHRFVDPADKLVYLYTQFEVPDARRVYTTFEQPDLKSEFVFHVTAPSHWQVVSNSPTPEPEDLGLGKSVWHFEPTKRMSTYITALVAGEYAVVRDTYRGKRGEIPLGIFLRESLLRHLDADDIFEVTKQGFAYFEDRFDMAYPFGKYDQLFVPEYNMGAMENAGCVTFRDEYIYRSRQTRAAYEGRANTILHEMAHMWFGDLVTMKWWDDSVAQRVVRRVGVTPGRRRRHPVRRVVDQLLQRPQDLGLPPGPAAVHPPDRGGQLRPRSRRGQLRRHHLRQGRLGPAAARCLGGPGRVLRRAPRLLPAPRLRQHRAR